MKNKVRDEDERPNLKSPDKRKPYKSNIEKPDERPK